MSGLLTVSYHSTKIDDHRYCGSADIISLHLTRDHVIKRSCDYEDRLSPPRVTTLPILVIIGISEGQI